MSSYDFIYDLLAHLEKDNMDYLLVTVDKGEDADKIELFYQAETAQSEQCIVYCFKKLVEEIQKGELPNGELKELDYGWVSQEELDEYLPPRDEEYGEEYGEEDEDEEI